MIMKRAWSNRIVMRYALLQMPGVALLSGLLVLAERWIDLPFWLVSGIIILWVIKDVILFPFVWRAYDWDGRDTAHTLI